MLQQDKGHRRFVQFRRVFWQCQFNDVSTLEVDRHLQYIGVDLDDPAAGGSVKLRLRGNRGGAGGYSGKILFGVMCSGGRQIWRTVSRVSGDQPGLFLGLDTGFGVLEVHPPGQQHEGQYGYSADEQ